MFLQPAGGYPGGWLRLPTGCEELGLLASSENPVGAEDWALGSLVGGPPVLSEGLTVLTPGV